MDFSQTVSQESLDKTVAALHENGMNSVVVDTAADAKHKVLEMIPAGSEVMTMTSVTLDTIGLAHELNESGNYDSVRNKLNQMDVSQSQEKRRIAAAPQYAVGSVHAVTEAGEVYIASNTGSQLPAYAYGAQHVIWVVGTHKIVPTKDDAMKRIYDYVLPQESERAKKAYGVSGSFVSKLLMMNQEINKDRITIVFVKEALGF